MARGRKSKNKTLKREIYFFCEGETEKIYFELLKQKYKTPHVKINIKAGSLQSEKLVDYGKRTIEHMKKADQNNISNVIVVFDKDNEDWKMIESAYAKAEQFGFNICFSNISFELWLLAHFEKIEKNKRWTIPELNKKLSEHLNVDNYETCKANKIKIHDIFKKIDKIENNISDLSCDFKTPNYTDMNDIINDIFK